MIKHDYILFNDRDKTIDKPRLILLNHIQKTGGTTILKIISENLGGEFLHIGGYHDWENLRKNQHKFRGKDLFCDGSVWGLEKLFNEPRAIVYITMLRDPIKVFRSYFSYTKSLYDHRDKYLSEFMSKYSRNFLLYSFSDGDVEIAKKRILNPYCIFGLTEYFKESVYLISKCLQLEVKNYKQQNKSHSEIYELSDALRKEFYCNHKQDYQFYDFATSLFRKRLEEVKLK